MASREFCRVDPEELLRRIEAQQTGDDRGRLKIFLGYAPRVGKSFRMFDEGRRRKKRGQDVVVGAIQTKGSREIEALIREFEVIPPRRLADVDLMDVEAIIRRKPEVCLVDELAKDNPPGSPRAHRWQDVDEIRAHGIHVVGAVNLQHIDRQRETVERITGKRAESSVPQPFIESADELVIVDVPEDGGAPHLSDLREAALLLAAQVVERQLQAYMDAHGIRQSWGTQERILVCITPCSSAKAMLQSGARNAGRFHGQLLVLYVKQRELDREAEAALDENLDYARKLGADVHVVEGSEGNDAVETIIGFAHRQRITQLFVGHTRQRRWPFRRASPLDRLIQAAEGMDVRIFPPASTKKIA